jgi:hypothetical protein
MDIIVIQDPEHKSFPWTVIEGGQPWNHWFQSSVDAMAAIDSYKRISKVLGSEGVARNPFAKPTSLGHAEPIKPN